MSDPDQYTVGWICALEIEYVAARAFLEKVHSGPTRLSPNDNNHYTVGEIEGHYIAIAVLPEGEHNTTSTAVVARDMMHSFPNIKFGLLVGTAGGVPTRHDIRLGDVIVSSPKNGRGGVIQYDLGKELQGQPFQQTGFLNQPPLILRTAVMALRAQYSVEGHRLEDSIRTVLESSPELMYGYARPALGTDRLYESDFIHMSPQKGCEESCGSSRLIQRSERAEHEDNPAIHYGLIASGSRLIGDALLRDKFAAEYNVLCFEMEAAGLMNHFPCLVIRGVSNYADSHRGKDWQGYAAMVAAAYARDLLYQIVPQRVSPKSKTSEALDRIQERLDDLQGIVNTIKSMTRRATEGIEDAAGYVHLGELPMAEGDELETYLE
ncbi:nucleoside phosphorylase domain-containing protein [Aspergillus crustosus]